MNEDRNALEAMYQLAEKRISVVVRYNYGWGFVQATFAYPDSERAVLDKKLSKVMAHYVLLHARNNSKE